MQRALAKLEESGLVYANRTEGRYVTEDVEMVRNVKNRLAEDLIEEFLQNMKRLGFSEDEIITVIKNIGGAMNE